MRNTDWLRDLSFNCGKCVRFCAHNFSLRLCEVCALCCVYVNESYFTRFNLEKVFDLIEFVNQKLHRKECVCAARYEVNEKEKDPAESIPCKEEIQFNYTRSASSTCTESMFSTDRSQQITVVHMLPLALFAIPCILFWLFQLYHCWLMRLFMNEQSFSQVNHQVRLIFQLILVDVHSHRHYQITTNILA